MQRYCNAILYAIVILIMCILMAGTIVRYRSDLYFNIARKCIPAYAQNQEGLEVMQWAYNNAVRLNPLEATNYQNRLNMDYLRLLSKKDG